MGQSPSSEPPKLGVVDPAKPDSSPVAVDPSKLDFRVVNPPILPPTGLALIAHGRRATPDYPVASALAACLREKHGCRTVTLTWGVRAVGKSEGAAATYINDYNRALKMAMEDFTRDFPTVTECRLFICGHKAGAGLAGTVRAPSSPHFDRKTRYILISYPAVEATLINLRGTSCYYRALEALVQVGSCAGEEPPADVLVFTGSKDTTAVRVLCSLWIGTLTGKIRGDNLKMEIVEGADDEWKGYYDKIADVTDRWLSHQSGSEGQIPSDSASSVISDRAPSVAASSAPVRRMTHRFSGQVL